MARDSALYYDSQGRSVYYCVNQSPKMPYALVIQPQLVSILDFDGNPADVWVVEVPSWVAKFLSESSLDDENQIEAEPPRNPFSVYYAPRSRSNGMSFHLRVYKFHANNVSH